MVELVRRRRGRQLWLELGALRKRKRGRPKGSRSGRPRHRPRDVDPRCPHHVTMKVLPHVFQLRSRRCGRRIFESMILGHQKPGARVVQFSIQHDHVHMVVEADGRRALATTIQGLAIRIARRLNRVMGKKGKVFAERFHSRLLQTPTEIRRTLLYVLQNARKHFAQRGHVVSPTWTDDEYSSAPWFRGWTTPRPPPAGERPVAEARTWLLARGWIRRGGGALGRDEVPA